MENIHQPLSVLATVKFKRETGAVSMKHCRRTEIISVKINVRNVNSSLHYSLTLPSVFVNVIKRVGIKITGQVHATTHDKSELDSMFINDYDKIRLKLYSSVWWGV